MADRSKTTKKAAARKATTATKRSTGSRKAAASTATARKATAANAEVVNATGECRLGKGGLEKLVADHLKQHPRSDFSSTELSHLLNRSNGAIQNALEKFVKLGTAKRTSEQPRRYQHKAARVTGAKKKAV